MTLSFSKSLLALTALGAIALACGSSQGSSSTPATKDPKTATGAVTPKEWTDLCEAQAERARRCPGPAPESTATCADSAACVGQLVRPDVIRALARCQNQNDCTRPCSIDRVTASLPPAPANLELEQACAMRRIVCPTLDCNALARPVRALEPATIEPLVECLKFERSCLDVAACYLEKLTPIVGQFSACGFGDAPPPGDAGAGEAGTGDAGAADAASGPR